jgi:hypothetical protein
VTVQVVVPFRGGCPHRERAWRWVRARYQEIHPDWEVVEAPAPEGAWCKGAAINPAVEASEAEIVIQADADCWTDGLADGVAAVEAGAGWAIPHLKVWRLSEEATAAVLGGADWEQETRREGGLAQRSYNGLAGGGLVVARRETLLEVPIDERFRGWGGEDEAHSFALNALVGPPWRGTADLYHLWHPPQERLTRRRGSKESWALRNRYAAARGRPDRMRRLLEEAGCLSPA